MVCLGLYAVQKISVSGHRVVLIDQLGKKTVFYGQAVGVEGVALIAVYLLILVEQFSIFFPVILLDDAVAIR